MTAIGVIERALDGCLTVGETARLARVNPATVRRAFDRGLIEGVRSPTLGRLVLRTAAERWAASRVLERRAA